MVRLFITIAVLSTSIQSVIALPFGQEARELIFDFRINGYEAEKWFDEPTAIALDDRKGLLYIADRKDGSVSVFTLHGVPKTQYTSEHGIKSPIGLAVDSKGNLYVTQDGENEITIITPEGETDTFELSVGGDDEDNPPKFRRLAFDRHDNLYIIDHRNCVIYVLDKERELSFNFGGKGDKRGEFHTLEDVAVDRQGRIYALDSGGSPVNVFDRNGKYLYRFGFKGDGHEDVLHGSALFVDMNDQIWVMDRGQHALKVFDRSGTFLHRFGRYGVDEGLLFQPIDAQMDRFGQIFILEAGAKRLQVFSLNRPFERLSPTGL